MAKEEVLAFDGIVNEVLPDARYRVQLDNGHILIKTLVGDRVTVEVTPYDLDKGRLVFRHKGDAPPRPPGQNQRPNFRR
jgi:translation initiation factor IF-1